MTLAENKKEIMQIGDTFSKNITNQSPDQDLISDSS